MLLFIANTNYTIVYKQTQVKNL